MGYAARNRGTRQQRIEQAIQRGIDKEVAIEARKQLRREQYAAAYKTMVWWQFEMSEIRHNNIMRARMKTRSAWSAFMGMLYGSTWDSLSPLHPLLCR